MDFEYTSRPSSTTRPSWASDVDDPSTPRKQTNTPTSPFPPHTPTFGRIHDVPFMLNIPPPQTPQNPNTWVPPDTTKDVDMAEASPPQPSSKERDENDTAAGGLIRVFKSRQRQRERSRLAAAAKKVQVEDDDESGGESDEEEDGIVTPITQNTSNHYTLNLPSPTAPQSDTPYVLLGYLQFFFNLSLVLLFLYLLVQFILTVQRDVEHRISEYSMDIVQEIAQCAMHYRANLCVENPIPAMAHQCGLWETCMNRDPTKVGRARVGAELIAEVVNGFVEPISWKTLIFSITSLSFLTVFVNSLLSLYRSRHNPANAHGHAPPPAIPSYPLPPITPYQQHHLLPGNPGWGKSWAGPQEVEEVATRRRKLESGAAKEVR
ncbi:Di-sulfide bridge nucleocytoplasmic transport domain-containing protein [Cytidiella melzeri]|nr:Di-sulfide bridge nucleocytoplasmic transport domain-containing protein [Cytidiella melzeri]